MRLGADVNAQDRQGASALFVAVLYDRVDTVRVLLAAPGIDVNLAKANGRAALSWARGMRRATIVALLEAAGAR